MSEINFNGWIRTIDRLPSIEEADDAGHVYQCEKTNNGFRFLNDCHIALLRMDKDRKCLNGREYWHSKPKAPKLPKEGASHG
ncbi:hypothetical protein [Acinetobacter oleivorans]